MSPFSVQLLWHYHSQHHSITAAWWCGDAVWLERYMLKSHSMMLFWLVVFVLHQGQCFLPQKELLALKDIYDSTGGAEFWDWGEEAFYGPVWFSSNLEIQNMNPCNDSGMAWQGVRCSNIPEHCDDDICHVIYLQLPSYNISGPFFHDSIADLSYLQVLNMYSNPHLSGTIPSSVGELSNLFYMDFSDCFIGGSIPSELGKLTDMWRILLSRNSITGSLPPQLMKLTGIEVLELFYNYLTGSLPPEYSALSSLRHVDLKYNFITGSIPEQFGSLTSLRSFEILVNHLTGTIPPSIGNWSNLQVLDFDFNELCGTIPRELGLLTKLEFLYFYSNHFLTGSIPKELGNLVKLNVLDLGLLNLGGTIPSEFGCLTSIQALYLDDNHNVTGQIPSELGALKRARILWLHENSLSSSIPSELYGLASIESLAFYRNLLSGTIPELFSCLSTLTLFTVHGNKLSGGMSPVVALTNLKTLWLDGNKFTGHIPSTLSQLEELTHLRLQDNLFSGTLPDILGHISNLQLLELEQNGFSGTLPASIGNLNKLRVFKVWGNMLSGTIPSLFNMSSIEDLVLRDNQFSGPLRLNFDSFSFLEFLDISSNRLSGNLPASIGALLKVSQVYIQGNYFSGSLDKIFSHPEDMSIAYFDASDNRFSGSVPANIFNFRNISVIALSINCFEGSLPADICASREVKVLSMDGLGASSKCRHSFTMPFTHITLFNKLEGTVPSCVFSLPKLEFLHMTGNGLTGTLATLSENSSIDHFYLSHNQLTSTIPISFQMNHFHEFDLSYNKITGEYSFGKVHNSSTVSLKINRLSGNINEKELEIAKEVRILRGNIFSCQHLPHNDPDYENYACGSSTLDDAYFLLSATAVAVFIFVLCILGAYAHSRGSKQSDARGFDVDQKSYFSQVYVLMVNIKLFLEYRNAGTTEHTSLGKIMEYTTELRSFSIYVLILSCVGIVSSAPVLLLKLIDNDHKYVTHQHVYSWNFSVAFITGEIPAALLLASWMVSCSLFVYTVCKTLKQNEQEGILAQYLLSFRESSSSEHQDESASVQNRDSLSNSNKETKSKVSSIIREHVVASSIALVLVNIALIAIVNGLYIVGSPHVASSIQVLFQFALALFNVAYAIFVVPALTVGFKRHDDAITVRIWLLLLNSIVIPCVVTAITSPSCVQGIFVEPDEVSTYYTYTPDCAVTKYSHIGEPICTDQSDITVEVAPLTPPFTYNYQCTNVILTAYIPVFLYTYSIKVCAPFVFLCLLCFLKYERLPKPLRRVVPGILFPNIWSRDDSACRNRKDNLRIAASKYLYNIKTVTSNLIHNIVILLTFGLCSPILSCLIGVSTYLVTATWRILIARFVHYRIVRYNNDSNGSDEDYSLSAMGVLASEAKGLVRLCLWPYACLSCIFFLCLSWDMAGDRVGWLRGIWAPVSSLLALSSLYFAVWLLGWRSSRISTSDRIQNESYGVKSSIELASLSCHNPMISS